MITPIPCRKHLKRCSCGKRPQIGMNKNDGYRVGCMKMARGCGVTTLFYINVKSAEKSWNGNYGKNF